MTTVVPIHPGEILAEEFLEPLEISQNRLAVAIGVPPRRINDDRPHRRHRAATRPLLRHHRPILA